MTQTSSNSQKLVIQGGTPLKGVVRLGGAKNASYKLMIASIMADSSSRILNLPDIADVRRVATIVNELGGQAKKVGPKTLSINPTGIDQYQIDIKHGRASRASTLFVGPLLAKFGQAEVPLPGGDKIGKRPLGRHLEGLEKLGA
jgi:UDP-N-acetylglucosamine 1-carboxyvinyltransferase